MNPLVVTRNIVAVSTDLKDADEKFVVEFESSPYPTQCNTIIYGQVINSVKRVVNEYELTKIIYGKNGIVNRFNWITRV